MRFSTISRRKLLSMAAKTGLGLGVASLGAPVFAEEKKLMIGYWPLSAGLPFYVAMDRGLFKEAGVNVEAVKFASPNQVVDAMIAGRLDGCANRRSNYSLGSCRCSGTGFN